MPWVRPPPSPPGLPRALRRPLQRVHRGGITGIRPSLYCLRIADRLCRHTGWRSGSAIRSRRRRRRACVVHDLPCMAISQSSWSPPTVGDEHLRFDKTTNFAQVGPVNRLLLAPGKRLADLLGPIRRRGSSSEPPGTPPQAPHCSRVDRLLCASRPCVATTRDKLSAVYRRPQPRRRPEIRKWRGCRPAPPSSICPPNFTA